MPRPARLSRLGGRNGALRGGVIFLPRLVIALCFWFPAATIAQEVTLRSAEGSIEVTGEVVEFDGDYWRIRSEYGSLTLRADRVDCMGPGCPGGRYVQAIRVTGAEPSVSLLWPALIEAYGDSNGLEVLREDRGLFHTDFTLSDSEGPLVRVEARPATSGDGFEALADGRADLVLALRDPDEEETALFGEAGAPKETLLAHDALVISGDAGEQADLRDDTLAARLVFPDDATGVPDLFTRLTGQKRTEREGRVAGEVGLWSTRAGNVAPVTDACGISRAAGGFTVAAGEYPLALRHSAYQRRDRPSRRVGDILSFARSEAGQVALAARGFLPLEARWRRLEEDGPRLLRAISSATGDVSAADLRRVAGRLSPARQASVVIGFGADGSTPDAGAMRDLQILVEALVSEGATGVLTLAGFSDAEGSGAANLTVSRSRAATVAEAVKNWLPGESGLTIEPRGFGEAFPATCNETAEGRLRNRRVEVWFAQR